MATVIAIVNQKGGVGKTTTTINLGAALVETGKRVLLIDLDPQGMLGIGLGLRPYTLNETLYQVLIDLHTPITTMVHHLKKPHFDLVPANIDLAGAEVELLSEIGRERILKDKLAPVRSTYDFILLDCPPSLGLLTINALTAAEGVLVPVECQYFAFRELPLLLETIERIRRRTNPHLRVIGIVPTKYERRTTHSREVLEELRSTYKEQVIATPIKLRVALADASVGGQTIFEFEPDGEAADAYRQLAKEVMRRV